VSAARCITTEYAAEPENTQPQVDAYRGLHHGRRGLATHQTSRSDDRTRSLFRSLQRDDLVGNCVLEYCGIRLNVPPASGSLFVDDGVSVWLKFNTANRELADLTQ